MALTTDEKAYVKRLRQSGADDENVLYYLKQRRDKEFTQNNTKEPGLIKSMASQAGQIGSQIVQGVANIPKKEGLIRKTWGDFEKRAEKINTNNATMPMGDRRTLRNVGQYLGAANDLIGNTFVSGIKTFVPKSLRDSVKDVGSIALETKPGQVTKEVAKNAYTQWKAFEKSNPELAKDLGAVGNIANFALNFVGGSQASKIKPIGLGDDVLSNINRGVRNTASKVSPTVQNMASKIPGQVDNLSTGAAEVGISAASGLSREAQQIIKKQPGLYQQARQGTITREAVTDDVVGALSKRMDDISDLGKGYETIRTSSITVPKNDIANIAVSHLDDMKVSKIDLPIGDRGTVQKALDYIRELPDTMTAQNALSLRRKFDDLINWKSEATGEGKRIIRGLRKKVDDYLGEKLPGLKDLDRKYGPEREFIDKVKGTILDKQGNLKDGAISSVANMIGKGKEMKLDRFEKLLPGIGDKVRALKAFEEIQNLGQIKTGAVARQIFSFAVGGIPGFVATNPYVVGYALEKYGFAKEAIKRILSKGKKISEAEAKAVHRAVKSVSKKEVEKIIDAKVGTPLLPAGKSSVATGNTGGKLPPADLTPNASIGNAVSSQARISPPQTAGLLDSPKSTISETAQQVSTPVVKSPGEKVISPTIPKSQPKAKLRTNEDALKKAVKTRKVDSEIESLQKTQESLPGVSEVEVPADYTPTDGLPTGIEFESIVLPKAIKGKIPSPDIKRPQIRGIDLGPRNSKMINGLKEQGLFTDSYFAITDKNLAKKFIDYAEQKAIKKGVETSGNTPDIKSLIRTAEISADTPITPKEFVKGMGDKGIFLKFDIGDGNQVAIDASYADVFFKNFDDVTFKGSNELSPVVVYSKGKNVGVIMPIKDPYSFNDKLGNFTVASKLKTNKEVLPKPETKLPKTPQEGKTVQPYGYKALRTTQAPNEINADLAYEKASKGIGVEIINDVDIKDIKKLYDKNIKTSDISERIDAVREIKGSVAYANATHIENKALSNSENYNNWNKIFNEKLNAPNNKPKPSLPLSQKSEVKYSKPDLVSVIKKPSDKMIEMAKEAPHRLNDFENSMSGQMYWRGSAKDVDTFDTFDMSRVGKTHYIDWGRGISFAKKKEVATNYMKSAIQGTDSKGFVKEFYLDPGAKTYNHYKKSPRETSPELGDELAKKGYDALYIYDETGRIEEVLVMNPKIIYNEKELKNIWSKANKK